VVISPSDIQLTGRVAVVTGGGTGIGLGIAAGMAACGATVAIWERDADSCTAAADSLGALGITTDVRDSEQVNAALQRTTAELGPVTILVNNAGGTFFSPLLDTSENGSIRACAERYPRQRDRTRCHPDRRAGQPQCWRPQRDRTRHSDGPPG
jgi:3-oxoacyl-[acyl-carrier protein] reductase